MDKVKSKKPRRKLLKITLNSDMVDFMQRGGFYYCKPDDFPTIKIKLMLDDEAKDTMK